MAACQHLEVGHPTVYFYMICSGSFLGCVCGGIGLVQERRMDTVIQMSALATSLRSHSGPDKRLSTSFCIPLHEQWQALVVIPQAF